MSWTNTVVKIAEGALGLYLFLPSVEDVATGGLTLVPSAVVGGALLLDAFGVDIKKVFS